MSYILNALRKSEQERQAVAPDTVTNRILSPQPQRPQGPSKLIIALIISNLLIVAYFIGFNQKAPSVDKPDSAALTSPEIAPVAPPAAKVDAIDAVPPPAAAVAKSPTIADIVAAKKTPAPPSAVKPDASVSAPVKAAPAARPNATPAAKPLIDRKPAAVPTPASPTEQPQTPPDAEPAAKIADTKPAALPAKNEIPFLHELPAEFRRDIPKLSINVFVYAKEPAERFVMIDMVKYKPGQVIKDALELTEIRPDSLVVRYHNRTFQIERP